MPVVLNTEAIKLMNLFDTVTHVPVKDCIVEENVVYFLVEEGHIKEAIGKNGSVVKTIESLIKKNVRVYEYSKDVIKFIKNLIPNAKDIRIKNKDGVLIAEVKIDKSLKPLVIGREGKNIKVIKQLLKRNHNVSNLVVR